MVVTDGAEGLPEEAAGAAVYVDGAAGSAPTIAQAPIDHFGELVRAKA